MKYPMDFQNVILSFDCLILQKLKKGKLESKKPTLVLSL